MNLILFDEDEIERPLPPGDPRSRHLRKVLHARPGDEFTAGVVGGRTGRIRIAGISDDGIDFRFTPGGEPPPLLPLELVIGAPRPLVTKRLLKDLTSLGARALRFVTAELGEKSYLESGLWRNGEFRGSLREGAEQAGTTLFPEVRLYPRLGACLESLPAGSLRFVLDPVRGRMPAGGAETGGRMVVLAVGPERGWTPGELDRFAAADFSFLRMGDRILRTEAAALAGAAILLSRMGIL